VKPYRTSQLNLVNETEGQNKLERLTRQVFQASLVFLNTSGCDQTWTPSCPS